MSNLPSKEDWENWLTHPATEAVRARARLRREELKESWSAGAFTSDTEFKTVISNISAHAACGVHEEYGEMDYEVMIGDLESEHTHSNTPKHAE